MASTLAALRHLLICPGSIRCTNSRVLPHRGCAQQTLLTERFSCVGFGAVCYSQLELRTRDTKVTLAPLWLVGRKCPCRKQRGGRGMESSRSAKESWGRNPLGESVRSGKPSRAEVSFCCTAHSQDEEEEKKKILSTWCSRSLGAAEGTRVCVGTRSHLFWKRRADLKCTC